MEHFSKSKATTCEDTVEIECDDYLVELKDEFIPELCALSSCTPMMHDLQKEVDWVRVFLKTDYPWRHCKTQSPVASHCIMGALCGSAKEPELDTPNNIEHVWGSENCSQCDRIPQLFQKLRGMACSAKFRLTQHPTDNDKMNKACGLEVNIEGQFAKVKKFMSHQMLRRNSRNCGLERRSPINFTIGTAEHTMDYMSKLEDKWHAESQADRFAKVGRSCYGHAFITPAPDDDGYNGGDASGDLLMVNVRLFVDDSKQDFEHSTPLLKPAIMLFQEVCPWVTRVNASHDGGSHFELAFDLCYPRVCAALGLEAGIVDKPETGAGKDVQDADFSNVSYAIKAGVDAKMDAISSESTANIVDSFSGAAEGKINRVCTLTRGVGPGNLKRFIQGEIYRWEHRYEDGVYKGSFS